MAASARDRTLRILGALFIAITIVSMVLSLTGLEGPHPERHRIDDTRGWLGLAWFALLVAVLWRGARQLHHLRRLVASREEQIAAAGVTSHDWMWESTPEMIATYCSPAVAEILGRDPGDVIGRSFHDFVAEPDRVRVREVTNNAIAQKHGWDDVEIRWLHADGHAVTLQGSAVPIFDDRRNLVGFRGTRRLAPGDDATRQRLAAIAVRVRELLDHAGITSALQPIIDVAKAEFAGAEALARFPDNRTPDIWFAEAHEVGLGLDLELLALRRALNTLSSLPPHAFLSVNASPALTTDPRLAAVLDQPHLPLERIVIEITEHVAVDRYDDITTALLPLRERGLRLAIDDAGAGYASFAHVLKLRPDIIKIDRSLIADIHADPARRAFVTAIVLLALELDATVTAEGVENVNELQAVATLGIDHAQGYLLAKPTTDPVRWSTWKHTNWPSPPKPADADTSARPGPPHTRTWVSDGGHGRIG